MIKLSKKAEYGLISLLHISDTGDGEITTCREVAERYHIPSEILGKVLQALAKAKLIESTQGAKGGYRLNRPLGQICFGQVIEALDGPIHLTPCSCENYVCPQESQCNIKEPVFHFQDQLMKYLYSINLDTFRNVNDPTPML